MKTVENRRSPNELCWEVKWEIARAFWLALDVLWPAAIRINVGIETRDSLLKDVKAEASNRVGTRIRNLLEIVEGDLDSCHRMLTAFWASIGSESEMVHSDADEIVGEITSCVVWDEIPSEVKTDEVCRASCEIFLSGVVQTANPRAKVNLIEVRPTQNTCKYQVIIAPVTNQR